MNEILRIRGYMEKLAYITSIVLEMSVIICDTEKNIVGDSARNGEICSDVEMLRSESVVSKAMELRETIIMGNAKEESEGCINCPKKEKCDTETIIAYPIMKNGVVYGGIGIFSDRKHQKEKLIELQKVMLEFLDEISDLIIGKVEEERIAIEMKAENMRMDSIIETLDFALLSFDENFNILYSNGIMKKILKHQDNLKDIKAYITENLFDESERRVNTIYLRKLGKMTEYEMTFVPIKINGESKGAEIYLKESSDLIRKANKLMQPIKRGSFDDIIGKSESITSLKNEARTFADSKSSVLIQGESGTGKEVLATAMHMEGNRSNGPFVTVNCAAIPDNLLESELFGYVGGAFTGASKEGRAGKFEIANGGTLFLDEIGEMPIHLQPKLLRALQERKIQRVGSNRVIDIDIRVIAATNRNLVEMMENGSFREDLYYRLCVIPMRMPALRERKEDIPELAQSFLETYCEMLGKPFIEGFEQEVFDMFYSYEWTGNVRELQNTVEYAVNRCADRRISVKDLPLRITRHNEKGIQTPILLKDMERNAIVNALQYCSGSADVKGKAAKELGLSRATLYRKIKEYEILM